MCFFAILCTKHVCGHVVEREEVQANCHGKTCIFSTSHNERRHDCQHSCIHR
ncbi:uncharacterized protein SCHCODRAFT_02490843 [Schizophyllum commune H4-8]|uniref:uncharacterized protein n=1 Tax=Schizophyllum commune (strain H4-8 / FGSC 9210) TaxID=578458 RepID=UPI00215F5F4E|nr:uncharacterized protein SCHCODRAFT_02496619 [Schizophyllum commune H4-8]XP_050201893.1 uncharacterized protein SCHCODRAFT_02490843 [Schizophyllum commune H4-8]KAI5895168.1 hypothetical protein SCHCODRAFT_02496619 [Schizophyllum commune H4-8]KAI5897188.1 hypothetical protein SCHCODRAFT_02490843 [Schizophyllum commune H4-8]